MYELPRTIPEVKMLLALAPEELASTILLVLPRCVTGTGNATVRP
jgi:hypothetical protein